MYIDLNIKNVNVLLFKKRKDQKKIKNICKIKKNKITKLPRDPPYCITYPFPIATGRLTGLKYKTSRECSFIVYSK